MNASIPNHKSGAHRYSVRRSIGFGALAIALLLGSMWPAPSRADLYVDATSGVDVLPSFPPLFNDCTHSNSPCRSIPYALTRASANDTINLQNGPFFPYSSAFFTGTDIVVNKSLTIRGLGGSRVVVDAELQGRHFNIAAGGVVTYVTIDNLELINGQSQNGGSILVDGGGELVLTDSTLKNNSAVQNGGAVSCLTGSELKVTASKFVNNTANSGGAIYASDAEVNVGEGSTIRGNTAAAGAGIFFQTENFSDLILDNAAFIYNSASISGGALFHAGSGYVQSTGNTYRNNSAGVSGGAISIVADDLFILEDDTFESNTAALGGAVVINGNALGRTHIRQSTFSGNTASGDGGGLHFTGMTNGNDYDVIHLVNSTLSGNSAARGAAVFNTGAGLMSIVNSTLYGNIPGVGQGAIHHSANRELNIQNSIITQSGGENDCLNPLLQAIQGRHNLSDNCGAVGSVFNLGPVTGLSANLKDNGGLTKTHRLLAQSNAIDKGYNDCIDPTGGTALTWDQRGDGYFRPEDGNGDGVATCDIGAFEYHPFIVTPSFNPVPIP